MPKQKTNKGAKKRFKVTSTGKVLYKPAGRRHIMSGKKSKLRRQMRRWRTFDGSHDARDIRQMLNT
jgi:large subunit ribosomal protein L35